MFFQLDNIFFKANNINWFYFITIYFVYVYNEEILSNITTHSEIIICI